MKTVIAWLPVVMLPAATLLLVPDDWPRWMLMWLFVWTIFAGCKWLTWWTAPSGAPWWRHCGYLTLWPGLDADSFLQSPSVSRPAASSWLFAFAKFGLGCVLVWGVAPLLPREPDLLRGWVGMIGIVFLLHFGVFDILSLAWQSAGVGAKPLMNWPILATSVSEFWGQRWNTAFRDLTHRFLFRPLTIRYGAKPALCVGFIFSGVVHELAISMPMGAGWGGPMAFFLVQGGAVFLERSPLGVRLGLGRGVIGRMFALVFLAGPSWLLFHPPFVGGVIVPFLDYIVARRSAS